MARRRPLEAVVRFHCPVVLLIALERLRGRQPLSRLLLLVCGLFEAACTTLVQFGEVEDWHVLGVVMARLSAVGDD